MIMVIRFKMLTKRLVPEAECRHLIVLTLRITNQSSTREDTTNARGMVAAARNAGRLGCYAQKNVRLARPRNQEAIAAIDGPFANPPRF